jgi:hypothetical protein
MKSLRSALEKNGLTGLAGVSELIRVTTPACPLSHDHLSLKKLLRLADPDVVRFSTGRLDTGDPTNLTGEGEVLLQSDGLASFRGHVHNADFFGEQYGMAVFFDGAIDDRGYPMVFAYGGTVSGTGNPLSDNNDNWQEDGRDCAVIADKWDVLKASVESRRFHAVLSASTNLTAVVVTLIVDSGLGAAAAGFAYVFGSGAVLCEWDSDQSPACRSLHGQ